MLLLAAGICHASVVVFAFGTRTVIIAGDSRETYSDGTFRDTACKLGSYGDNVVFTHVGITSFGVTDFMAEARRAIADSVAVESAQSIAQRAAIRWKERAASILRKEGARELLKMSKQNGNPQLAAFLFASAEQTTGNISLWYATVTLGKIQDGVPVLETKAEEYGVDDPSRFKLRALGHEQIFWEYGAGKTARAKGWREELEKSPSPPERKLEETVMRLVELTIAYDAVGVGGAVDGLRLDVGKGVQWLQRKPACTSDSKVR